MANAQTFNPADLQFRFGVQPCRGVPAPEAAMIHQACISSETLAATPGLYVTTCIEKGSDPSRPISAAVTVGGDVGTEIRGEGFEQFLAHAFGTGADPVALPATGAYLHRLSAIEEDISFDTYLTIEVDRGDGNPVRYWDCLPSNLTATFANLAAGLYGFQFVAAWNGYYDQGRRLVGDSVTGGSDVRGHPPLNAWNLSAPYNDVEVEFDSVDVNAQTAVVRARYGSGSALSGVADLVDASAVISWPGGSLKKEVQVGDRLSFFDAATVSMLVPVEVVVLTVDGDEQLTAAAPLSLTEPTISTQGFKSFGTTTSTVRTGLDAKGQPYWSPLLGADGLNMGREKGGPLDGQRVQDQEVHLDVSGFSDVEIALTGGLATITAGTSALSIAADPGNDLTNQVKPGTLITVPIIGSLRVKEVVDDSNLTFMGVYPAGYSGTVTDITARASVSFASVRPSWPLDLPDAPVVPSFLATVKAGAIEYSPSTLTLTWVPPSVSVPTLKRNPQIFRQGKASGAVTWTARKDGAEITRFMESGGVLTFTVEAADGKVFIPGFDQERTQKWVAHGTSDGAPYTVTAADAADETLSCVIGGNEADPSYPAAMTLEIVNSEASLEPPP